MVAVLDPFAVGANVGFTLTEMTGSINRIPNQYQRLTELGLFRREGITTTKITVEIQDGVLNLLPAVRRGAGGAGPATVANRDVRRLRTFEAAHIPHDDYVMPSDVQGIRAFGTQTDLDPYTRVVLRKLERIRAKHEQTHEYMFMSALKGVLRDGAGVVQYDYFAEFGMTKKSVDFTLGTPAADIIDKINQGRSYLAQNLKGEAMTGVHVLCGPTFFGKLIAHPKVQDAYKFQAATLGANPLRDGLASGKYQNRMFIFGGVMFEEYDATVTMATGTTETLVPANGGAMFPLGTRDTYVCYDAPADTMETVNTFGVPIYAWQENVGTNPVRAIRIMTESNPIPINKRPELVVEIASSN